MNGIYLVSSLGGGFKNPEVLKLPIRGCFVTLRWSDLQLPNGTYNFQPGVNKLLQCVNNDKDIILAVGTGNECSGSLYPAIGSKIEFIQYRSNGNRIVQYLPNIIHPLYIAKWLKFLEAFVKHLKTIPAIWNRIVMIKATGLTANNPAETRQPFQTKEITGKPDTTDAIAEWLKVGYTEEYVTGMWWDIIKKIYELAPDKYCCFTTLGGQSFPCINSNGVYKYSAENNFALLLREYLCEKPVLTAINTTALRENTGTPSIVTTAQTTIKGYQEALNETVTDYRKLLENGLNHDASWLEISPDRALANRELVEEINEKLKQKE